MFQKSHKFRVATSGDAERLVYQIDKSWQNHQSIARNYAGSGSLDFKATTLSRAEQALIPMTWFYRTLFGKLLRAPLKLVPKSAVVPILNGPLRGMHWMVGAGFDAHWLGIYESEKAGAFQASRKPGDTVWDIGANVNDYLLLASVAVGADGRVLDFDPLPENLGFLRFHLERNRAENVNAIPKALGRTADCAHFARGQTRSEGHIAGSGEFTVTVIGGDEEIAAARLSAPDVIKMDIEGGELEALPGLRGALLHARTVFVATHGPEALALVESLGGFRCIEVDEYVRQMR